MQSVLQLGRRETAQHIRPMNEVAVFCEAAEQEVAIGDGCICRVACRAASGGSEVERGVVESPEASQARQVEQGGSLLVAANCFSSGKFGEFLRALGAIARKLKA